MIDIGIVQFPGSNCERATRFAVKRAGMNPVDVMWHSNTVPWKTLAGFIIIGGFSFEDRCRSGAIAARSPLMKSLLEQAQQGKPILGICNGAQILVESGLVPGCINTKGELINQIAIADNQRIHHGQIEDSGYINDWCTIKAAQTGVFGTADTKLHIPFAHAQGRFMIDPECYQQLKQAGIHSWHYCKQNGEIDPHFPTNPNGSLDNLAAISNISGNVLAMMPHPERTKQGDPIFAAMRHYIEHSSKKSYQTLKLDMPDLSAPLLSGNLSHSLLIKLCITDNEAVSVQKALEHLGFAVTVNKWLLWQIDATEAARQHILDSQELFNTNKEALCDKLPNDHHCFLVHDKTDIHGQYILRVLQQQYQIEGINSLQRGIVWGVSGATPPQLQDIIATGLLANPVSQTIHQVINE